MRNGSLSLPLGTAPPRGRAAEGDEVEKYARIFHNVISTL